MALDNTIFLKNGTKFITLAGVCFRTVENGPSSVTISSGVNYNVSLRLREGAEVSSETEFDEQYARALKTLQLTKEQ